MDEAPNEAQLQRYLTALQARGCTVTRSGVLLSIETPGGRRFQSGDQPSEGSDPSWGPVLAAAAEVGLSEADTASEGAAPQK